MKGSEDRITWFLDGMNKRFAIPVYQRKYDWKYENCRQLYDDLVKIAKNDRQSHFFGSIVSEVVPIGGKIVYHVIDGQQRLTTITLMLLAIKNLIANEKGPANELPIEVKLFYVSLPGTILYCFIAPMTGTLVAPPKSIDVAFIIAVGLFNAGGYFFMMYGISKLGAAISSFVSMLEPIVSVIFSTLWFHDPVTIGIVVGGGLVMASILLIAIDGAKKGNSA